MDIISIMVDKLIKEADEKKQEKESNNQIKEEEKIEEKEIKLVLK